MNGTSLDIKQDQINKLKELFPEAITEGKVDWEKLKATLGEDINFSNERYVLNWAGKSDAFKILQQSTTDTLIPCPEESVNFETTQNVFIEGENLRVLMALQKAYYGKIKCIIIDPPYNTGSDSFIYPDKFSEKREDYQKRVGDKDEDGYMMKEGLFHKNSKDSGHFHSNWLSMMYPRLFLAKNLLRDDGVIFVHIDDNEIHNLRLILNEIFGEENFIAEFVWQSKKGGGSDNSGVVTDHEYILCFCKNSKESPLSKILIESEELDREDKNGKYRRGRELNKWGSNSRREDRPTMFFSVKGPNEEDVFPIRNDGTEGCWRWGKTKMEKIVKDENAEFTKREDGSYIVYEKIRNIDPRFKPYRTWLKDVDSTADGSKEVKELFGGKKVFSFPKPISLSKTIMKIGSTDDDDIILDFFSGSGTNGQAVLEINKEDCSNRKFILVQLPEVCDENSEAFKAGYKIISDISKERIRRVINNIEKEKAEKPDLFANEKLDLGFKAFRLSSSNFKIWRGDEISEDNLVSQLDAFTNPIKEGSLKENMLFELMLKAGYEITSPLEQNKKGGFYSINSGELVIALDSMDKDIVATIIAQKPKKAITLDNLFSGNDQLKTNTVLQMRDAGIDFKTI
jgi:adenine-specific DNA-methyltransferase